MVGKKTVLVWAIALLLFLTACSGGSAGTGTEPTSGAGEAETPAAEEPVKLNMGINSWIGYGPWWIAREEGIFQKYGLEVEIINMTAKADYIAAAAAGQVDVANLATNDLISMVANNDLDWVAVVFMDESHEADAVLTSEQITSVEQLKGKQIAFEEGTVSDLLIRQALADSGLAFEDITPVYVTADNAGLALASNKVEAAVTYEPYISTVMEQGGYHRLYTAADSPGIISDALAISRKLLTEKPELKEKLQNVWQESLDFWAANPERGDEIIAAQTGIPAEELPAVLEGMKFYSLEDQKTAEGLDSIKKAYQNIQSILLGQGVIEKEADIEQIIQIQ